MEFVEFREGACRALPIELNLVGPLSARTTSQQNVLPQLRKASAIFVILALTQGHSVSRRQLARLLWSRNDPGQGLARLRDTLHILRKSIRQVLGDIELVHLSGNRVMIKAGSVRIKGSQSLTRPAHQTSPIGAALDGLDPALDEWLSRLRGRLDRRPDRGVRAISDRGSVIGIGVLNAIGMGDDHYILSALAEEIIVTLAHFRGLFVVSSAFVTDMAAAEPGICGRIGLDFLIEGSVQRAGELVRIVVRLVNVETNEICWTSQFNHTIKNLLSIPKMVAEPIAAGIETQLPHIAVRLMGRNVVKADTVYGRISQAVSRMFTFERKNFMEAGELLRRSISIEPDYSSGYSWLALWTIFLVSQGWACDRRASVARAGEAAEHAVMLDPKDARGLAIAGHVHATLYRRPSEALGLHERALIINPNLPLAWHLGGITHAYLGNLDEARRRLERCRQLAPSDPYDFFVESEFILLEFLNRNHTAAIVTARRVLALQPRYSAPYKAYLAALGHLGEKDEAEKVYRRLLGIEPDFSVHRFRATAPFSKHDHLEHYATGLILAGAGSAPSRARPYLAT